MWRLVQRFRREEKGQDLIEFAVSVLLLLGLAAGIVDFGGAFQHYIVVTNASREGARQASRAPCDPASAAQRSAYRASIVGAVVAEAAVGNVEVVAADVAISPDPVATGCAVPGNPIVVTVSHEYTLQMAVLGLASLSLQGRTEMAYTGNDMTAGLPSAWDLLLANIPAAKEEKS